MTSYKRKLLLFHLIILNTYNEKGWRGSKENIKVSQGKKLVHYNKTTFTSIWKVGVKDSKCVW